MKDSALLYDLAYAYDVTPRAIYDLRSKLGMTYKQLCNVDLVFERLLEGRKSPLRTRLANAKFRDAAKAHLNLKITSEDDKRRARRVVYEAACDAIKP